MQNNLHSTLLYSIQCVKKITMSESNLEKYQSKLFPGSSHTWALKQLSDLPQATQVLDVGPGNGLMGAKLKEMGINALYALENDPSRKAQLSNLYLELNETLDLYTEKKFDLILLLDVLEHMTNPFVFFGQAAGLLKEGGKMLVSVPNIAHWSVRFPLLLGFFEYTERGILDQTHLSFFTRRRFKKLLATVPELELIETSASIEPLEFLLPKLFWDNPIFSGCSAVRLLVAKTLPGLFAYQHLALLQRTT